MIINQLHYSILIVFLSVFSLNTNAQKIENQIDSTKIQLKLIEKKKDSLKSILEKLELLNDKLEIQNILLPHLNEGEQLIEHKAMFLVYDENHEQSKWVAHKISQNIIEGNVGRTNDFREDHLISTGSASEKDYFTKYINDKGTYNYNGFGYDRGHLAPSADFRWSKTALSESYFYSNMSPQLPEFNRKGWAKLENALRNYVIKKKVDLFVVTGPVLNDNLKKIERSVNQISIPDFFYKVVYDPTNQKSLAYLLPHKEIEYPLEYYGISVDSLEKITGIDFLYNLKDTLENKIEQQNNYSFVLNKNKLDTKPINPNNLDKNQYNTIQARQFIGTNKSVCICGKVVSTHLSKNGHIFINLDKSFPDQIFSITIWKSNVSNFSYPAHKELKDKTICVKGKITENKGTPSMSVSNEKSIEIISE